MTRHAVCYVGSSGYLFSSVLSAVQARQHSDPDVAVVIVALSGGDTFPTERAAITRVCADHRIDVIDAPPALLGGLHPMFARLFLDLVLPADITEILYLDGDTQIVAPLEPLLSAEPPERGAIAVKDPTVFIHAAVPSWRANVAGGWERSGIPPEMRTRYINSGVLRIARDTLPLLRQRVLELRSAGSSTLRFADQDLINLALEDRVSTVSMAWNFPGFLLASRLAGQEPPRIIHFMSDPRPWQSPLWPWREQYHRPYVDLVADYPELAPYSGALSPKRRVRYTLQQGYKRLVEQPKWQSDAAARAVAAAAIGDLAL